MRARAYLRGLRALRLTRAELLEQLLALTPHWMAPPLRRAELELELARWATTIDPRSIPACPREGWGWLAGGRT